MKENHFKLRKGAGPRVGYIAKEKVPSFIRLFNIIREKVGSDKEATRVIGISSSVISTATTETKLSALHAKRILDTYNRLCK